MNGFFSADYHVITKIIYVFYIQYRDGSRLMERGGQNELRLSGLVQNEFQKRSQPVKMVVHLTKLSIYH